MKARALLSLLCVGLALPALAQSPSREQAARRGGLAHHHYFVVVVSHHLKYY